MNPTTHRTRFTPRNMIMELHAGLSPHRMRLMRLRGIPIGETTDRSRSMYDGNNRGIILVSSLDEDETDASRLALILQDEITPVLHDYESTFVHEGYDYRIEGQGEIPASQRTIFERIAMMAEPFFTTELSLIEKNILNGTFLEVLNHLDAVLRDSTTFSEEIRFRAYQRSFGNLMRSIHRDSNDRKDLMALGRLLSRARPMVVQIGPEDPRKGACPICHAAVERGIQPFCHNCGQKLKRITSKGGRSADEKTGTITPSGKRTVGIKGL